MSVGQLSILSNHTLSNRTRLGEKLKKLHYESFAKWKIIVLACYVNIKLFPLLCDMGDFVIFCVLTLRAVVRR